MTERDILEDLKRLRSKTSKEQEISKAEQEEMNRCRGEWLSFWRNNIHLYIKHKLGINTYDHQAIAYYLMSQATQYDELSSRGAAKSFRFSVFDVATSLLYPHSEIVITSSTFGQSTIIVEEKIKKELLEGDISPVLKYMYQNGYFEIKYPDQKVVFKCTFNQSTVTAVPCLDSARGLRANILQFDERILLKEGLINSIFKPMRRPRQAAFLNRPEYQNENKEKYLEPPKVMSISSNRFAQEKAHTEYVSTFEHSLKHPDSGSYICSWDIFTAIKCGIKLKSQFYEDKRTMDEISFRTEVLNLPITEIEGAFFKYNLLRENQILEEAFRPPTKDEYMKGTWSFRPKVSGEIRLVFGDLAFTGDVKGKAAADLTALGCLSIYKRKDVWNVDVEYIKTYAGGDPNTALYMRELVYFYDADYLIYDNRNGGDSLTNIITAEMHHPFIPDKIWHPNGLTVSDKTDLHFNTAAIIQEIRERTVDPNAIPIIIPMKATPEINHQGWMNMYTMLKNNQVHFLIDDLDYLQKMEQTKDWYKLDSEEKAQCRMPYIETRLTIDEAINLRSSYSGTTIKLVEPSNKTKDRCVALMYGLLLAQRIINREERLTKQGQAIDFSQLQLVF
ncbi:MAG: hypothetical protein KBT06_11525 [Prevotellaceae bacterium]|nr:hypothetical protein [Candidatus Colivivens equi]